jgi:acetyl esterase
MPLDPELEAILDAEGASGLPPRSERSVARTRELFRRSSLATTKLAVARVQDLSAHGVPLRLYAGDVTPAMPVLVYFHGGRFFSGDLDTHDALCREIAHEAQCVVVAADYRLAPEHQCPAAVEDCVVATEWVIREAAGLGLDSQRVAVGGDSAGGCLAAVVARHVPGIAAQWLIYPMLDPGCGLPSHEEFATGFGPGSGDMLRGWMEYLPVEISAHDDRITPLFIDPGPVPPAYILTAEFDCLRDEGELYAKRLGEAGNRVVHLRVAGAIHGFFQFTERSALARSALSSACGQLRALLNANAK